jgi:hypothetical protein
MDAATSIAATSTTKVVEEEWVFVRYGLGIKKVTATEVQITNHFTFNKGT